MRESLRRLFSPVNPLAPGTYHYQAPVDAPFPYRLHLRLHRDGSGLLILNASTILHLNQTAAEYAYHLVNSSSENDAARQVSKRYRVPHQQSLQDYRNFVERIQTLIEVPDLDPVMFLGFDRAIPYSIDLESPIRLDCAITYRLPEGSDPYFAPIKHVERELSTQEWMTILKKAWEVGIPHIVFLGGEPTLRDDLLDLIAFSEKIGQVTGLITNGLRFLSGDYFKNLLQTGLDHLMLLLDPHNLQSWEALRLASSADLFTIVHLTVTLHNYSEMHGILEKIAASGLQRISLTTADSALQPTIPNLGEQATELGLSLVWDLPVPYSSFHPIALEILADSPTIGAGQAWLYVEPDGDVLPAQGITPILGNLLVDPWERIWPLKNE
jgi:hypothetical protein